MKNNEKIFLFFFLIGIILFILALIYKSYYDQKYGEHFNSIQNNLNYNFENIATDIPVVKIDQNVCSKQCCKFNVWPTPFDTTNPNVDPTFMNQFIGTNLSCGNGPDNGGCVCMTKNNFNYIANHGQNYNEKYNNNYSPIICNILKNKK